MQDFLTQHLAWKKSGKVRGMQVIVHFGSNEILWVIAQNICDSGAREREREMVKNSRIIKKFLTILTQYQQSEFSCPGQWYW